MVEVASKSRVKVAPDSDPRWAQCRAGDIRACNSLIEESLPLLDQVVGVMLKKFPAHIEFDELRSFGVFGLIQAVKTYNPDKAGFRTHAVFLIKNRVYDELRAQDWAPKSLRTRVKDIEAARAEQKKILGTEPTTDQLATAMGKSTTYVLTTLQEAKDVHHKSLAEYEDVEGSLDSLTALHTGPEVAEAQRQAQAYMRLMSEWVETLTPQQQAVWALRYYREMSPLHISRKLRMRQIDVFAELREILASFDEFVIRLQRET